MIKNAAHGKSRPPQHRVTLSHLAHELDVDVSTISLALRDSAKISLAMKKKIRALARRRGYVPNAHARALAGGRSSLLGVLLPCAGVPFYSTMLDLLYEEATQRGLRVEAQFHHWDTEREIVSIRSMVERQAEGIVAFSSFTNPPRVLREEIFKETGIPIAFWGRQPKDSSDLKEYIRGFVTTDVRLGAKLAAEHLLGLGHRRIALLLLDQAHWVGKEKARGIAAAMKPYPDAKLVSVCLPASFQSTSHAASYTFESGLAVAREFLKQKPLPTAVMTTDDTSAQTLMTVLQEHGLRVPDDVSLAGSGNTFYSQYGAVPISCIDVPLELIAKKLVSLVTDPPSGERRREHTIVPHFTIRASTAPVPSKKLA